MLAISHSCVARDNGNSGIPARRLGTVSYILLPAKWEATQAWCFHVRYTSIFPFYEPLEAAAGAEIPLSGLAGSHL
jgi:hypothetical protein